MGILTNNKFTSFLSISAISTASFFSSHAIAKDAIDPGDSESIWVLGMAATALNSPYIGSSKDQQGYIYPELRYNGERFFIKDGSLNVRIATFDNVSGGLTMTVDDGYLSDKDNYEDNDQLADLKEREGTLVGGFYLNHDSNIGRLNFSVLTDLNNKHKGQSATFKYMFDMHAGNWNINPYLGASWVSDDIANYHVGISTDEATVSRAQYKAKSTILTFAGIRGRYDITDNWDIEIKTGITHLGSGISNSPIIEDDYAYHATFGFHYNF